MNRGTGQHRSQPGADDHPMPRQRSIQTTLAALLVVPLLSLIVLYVFVAASTVGGAVAKYKSDGVNKNLGAPTQAVLEEVDTERADTFVFQNGRGLIISRAALNAQRAKTDAAVLAFRASAAAASGDLAADSRLVINTILGQLAGLASLRAGVDGGKLPAVSAFESYDSIADSFFAFARGTENFSGEPISLLELGEGAGDEGQATELISREAALVGGVIVAGDRMSSAEHQLFTQSVDDQRILEQIGTSPQYWQQIPDPYTGALASSAFANLQLLENRIVASSPGTRLPVSPTAWDQGIQAVIGELENAETAARMASTSGEAHAGDVILLRLFVVGGAGLALVVASIALLLAFGRKLTRELTGLRLQARALADERLPSVVSRLSRGTEVDVDTEAPPLALSTKTREVTETSDAFTAVWRTAVEAAVGQARLRQGVSNVFRSLARRNQSLLQRQLRMLDEMERDTEDPEALARLFRLDHLTTRMRRQAEGLIILSGAAPGRGWHEPVPVVEVLRGATGEIEDYVRVDLRADSRDLMRGAAIADVTHLLSELIENAATYSPPSTRVQITAGAVANGYVVEIEDRGLGMPPEMLAEFNERLANPPQFDLADSDQLGLFVVSRLATRHGISVQLRGTLSGGTVAIVLLPPELVVSEDGAQSLPTGRPPAVPGYAVPGYAATRQRERSADQARSLISAMQKGWRTGRAAADLNNDERGETW